MIEMAPETAKRCKEKREERGSSPGRAVRRGRSQPFRRPQDVVHLPGYSACPVPTFVGTKGTCAVINLPERPLRILSDARRSGVAKDLKTEWFPAPSLLVSEQMASHHFDQIYEFTT
jgi:hypothetical protein